MASILIGLLSLPSIRKHLEINHFPKWRFLHIGFTWILLSAVGFILHATPVTSINIVIVAIVLFGIERLFSVTRHTRVAIPVGEAYGEFWELRVTPLLNDPDLNKYSRALFSLSDRSYRAIADSRRFDHEFEILEHVESALGFKMEISFTVPYSDNPLEFPSIAAQLRIHYEWAIVATQSSTTVLSVLH